MASVVAIGTLDTKGAEYEFLRERLRGHGVDVRSTSRSSWSRRSATPRSRPTRR